MLYAIRLPNRHGDEFVVGVNSNGQPVTTIFTVRARKFSTPADATLWAESNRITRCDVAEIGDRFAREVAASADPDVFAGVAG